jgi:SAM-dependent methyltransferase
MSNRNCEAYEGTALQHRAPSRYCSALDAANRGLLQELETRMRRYYRTTPYHTTWIRGINARWCEPAHRAQLRMCSYIPEGCRLLEVGCGDGAAQCEIGRRTTGVRYTGVDLNPALWPGRKQFIAAGATALPFRRGSFEVVLSMFVLEHIVFPHDFLDEAWRVLGPGGRLILIGPDFIHNAMASEWIGLSYGSGREKLKDGRVTDAILTTVDSRIRYPLKRLLRKRRVRNGEVRFPILLEPRCLYLKGFTPDCDAVYPSCPEEVINYLRTHSDFGSAELFFRDSSTFGLTVRKR